MVCERYKLWLGIRVNYHNAVILIVTSTQEHKSHSRHPEWNAVEGDVFGRLCNLVLGLMWSCVNQVARGLSITKYWKHCWGTPVLQGTQDTLGKFLSNSTYRAHKDLRTSLWSSFFCLFRSLHSARVKEMKTVYVSIKPLESDACSQIVLRRWSLWWNFNIKRYYAVCIWADSQSCWYVSWNL